MMDCADWSLIPEHMRGAVKRYIEHRVAPGSFLTAVLCNDLRGACEQADDINRYRLFDYIKFFYMYAPAGSWGSRENFERWVSKRTEALEAAE